MRSGWRRRRRRSSILRCERGTHRGRDERGALEVGTVDAADAGAERGRVERSPGDASLERGAGDLSVRDEGRAGGRAEPDAAVPEHADANDAPVCAGLSDARRAVERPGVRGGVDALGDRAACSCASRWGHVGLHGTYMPPPRPLRHRNWAQPRSATARLTAEAAAGTARSTSALSPSPTVSMSATSIATTWMRAGTGTPAARARAGAARS